MRSPARTKAEPCWASADAASGGLRREGVFPDVALTIGPKPEGLTYRFDVPVRRGARRQSRGDPRALRGGGRGDGGGPGASATGAHWRALLRERGLRCLQEGIGTRRNVSCSYDVRRAPDGGFEVALRLGAYDRTRALAVRRPPPNANPPDTVTGQRAGPQVRLSGWLETPCEFQARSWRGVASSGREVGERIRASGLSIPKER